jgi:hypothetical protein
MMTIRDMRAMLQNPRKQVDTWYGKNVMRRFSIYLTWVFVQLKCSPNFVTFLSLLFALAGSLVFSHRNLILGTLLINIWYLLDHVDGEIARFSGKSSATGFYFDTVINFLVQPFALVGLALGLHGINPETNVWYGILTGFGYLMLSIVPMCEDAVFLSLIRENKIEISSIKQPKNTSGNQNRSPFRIAFAYFHTLATFPNFLLLLTIICICSSFLSKIAQSKLIEALVFFYCIATNIIWILQLSQKVTSRKLDSFKNS